MQPVTMERTFNAPIAKVWIALTQKEMIEQWFVPISDFRPEPGFEFTFTPDHKESGKKHLCRVVESIPNAKLSYTWRYDGYPGESLVTWELKPDGDHTKLILTHSGLETFPSTPGFARQGYVDGWNYFGGRLQALTESN